MDGEREPKRHKANDPNKGKTVALWKQRLFGPSGLKKLIGVPLSLRGQGHEPEDLESVLRIYREFFHQTFPKVAAKDVLGWLRNCREGSYHLYSLETSWLEGTAPPPQAEEANVPPPLPMEDNHQPPPVPAAPIVFGLYDANDSEPDDEEWMP